MKQNEQNGNEMTNQIKLEFGSLASNSNVHNVTLSGIFAAILAQNSKPYRLEANHMISKGT